MYAILHFLYILQMYTFISQGLSIINRTVMYLNTDTYKVRFESVVIYITLKGCLEFVIAMTLDAMSDEFLCFHSRHLQTINIIHKIMRGENRGKSIFDIAIFV